jgi:hypothetical protein
MMCIVCFGTKAAIIRYMMWYTDKSNISISWAVKSSWPGSSRLVVYVSSVRPRRSDLAAEVILPAVAIRNSKRVLLADAADYA